jgi:nucleoside-diphosphate-sugar epimerase
MSVGRVAVLGANGFIGARVVEMLHLGRGADVRPIVRSAASYAPLSRFALDGRVADGFDREALRRAFEGCDVVVHSIAGSPEVILGTLRPVYRAAGEAGVRRLIYLSSASVHGQAPRPGTDDASPLDDRQPVEYNNAKVRAERTLRRLRAGGQVEIVILRPGIVLGPRSQWVTRFADALLSGRAYLVSGGSGVCNGLYVDNLVHAIRLAMNADAALVDGQALLLGDAETVTWRDLYEPIATFLGYDLARVSRVPPVSAAEWRKRQTGVPGLRRRLRGLLPDRVRRAISAAIGPSRPRRRSPWDIPAGSGLEVTLETSLLHTCSYKLPHRKATRLLGYEPLVGFQEGCRRTIAWMSFAGYPAADECANGAAWRSEAG